MTGKWIIADADRAAVERIASSLELAPPVARVLVVRGITEPSDAEKFLRKSIQDLVGPESLHGGQEAAKRLARAVRNKEPILVHGDFDADGITSAALLTLFFRSLGLRVIPFVPNRLIEGHGISPRAIEIAKSEGIRLVITCDCGISSAKEIAQMSSLGIETIVTDHHSVPEKLPVHAILVNPKLSKESDSHEDLSGVGVAFMLAAALRAELRESGFFASRSEPNLKELLDIVALGTLADMAPLRGQNRILVSHGLEQIARSRRPGILAMRSRSGLKEVSVIQDEDVGFRLAPRINAAARLGHADEALEIFLSEDVSHAEKKADRMEEWNNERKLIQNRMIRQTEEEVRRQVTAGVPAIILASGEFHPGVIGLVAQRYAQEIGLPIFVFAIEGMMARGSGRSRNGIHLVRALESVTDLLEGFGGHEEAGGCSLEASKLGDFSDRFRAAVRAQGIGAARNILIDAEVDLTYLNERVFSQVDRLRPFGVGNAEPIFLSRARVAGGAREVGKGHLRMSVVGASGNKFSAIGFGMFERASTLSRSEIDLAFCLERNEWKGRSEIQLRLKDFENV